MGSQGRVALASALAVLLCATHTAAFSPAGTMRRLFQAASTPEEQVVAFMRGAAEKSVANAEALVAAIQTGDMDAARAAYVTLRPEYEQIEHLYEVFGDIDTDIDARPDAHPYGEAYIPSLIGTPGAIFKGSHRIEALLYRDMRLSAALPWARQLAADYRKLVAKLQSAADYTAPCIWYGMAEVATEVAKKKISSEEETWSDQSILIFYNNLEGVKRMFEPWAAQLGAANATLLEQVNGAIAEAFSQLAPFVTDNADGTRTYAPYSTVPVTTRRAFQYAFYAVAEAVEQAAGALGISLNCEAGGSTDAGGEAEAEAEAEAGAEAEAEAGEAVAPSAEAEAGEAEAEAGEAEAEAEAEAGEAEGEASGAGDGACTPSAPAKIYAGDSPQVQEGLAYFRALMPYQQAASKAFTEAVASGNVTAAQAAYTATRPLYEQIEVLATSFGALDLYLDAREYVFPEGERNPDFTGFHKLERLVFGDEDVGDNTLFYAQEVERVLGVLAVSLNSTNPERFTSAANWEGMLNLATEVAAKKVSSEEETFSDLSLLIFYNNWKGILSQAMPYYDDAPNECEALMLAVRNATECLGIETQDDILMVESEVVTDDFADALLNADYKRYSEATMETRRCVVERGYAVRDALVEYANALGVVDDCSPFHFSSAVPFPFRADA